MPFVGKKIAVLGLGKEGQDVLNWLKINVPAAPVKIFDPYRNQSLTGFDIIFRSPGIWRLRPSLVKAYKAGALVTSATKLFFKLCPAAIIGVTGTKGKGTTATLIYQILKAAGKSAYLAGNIGKPMLELLPKLKSGDWVCLELSSFQLQDLTVSPHLAVILDIRRDHLDVHRSVKEYRRAKTNILRFQKPKDFAVINKDYPVTRKLAGLTRAQVQWFSKKNVALDKSKIQLRGAHNLENIAAAMTTAKLVGIEQKTIAETIYKFKGLEHRLEFVREVKGVRFYNDSYSTTPETAVAAVKAFSEPITLILGGSEKHSDYRKLGKVIVRSKNVRNLVLVGKMGPKIKSAAKGFSGRMLNDLKNMTAIVRTAQRISPPGSVVVLSPACASFDMFKNYQDRGDQFKTEVNKL